jgi:hypothetical protein
MRSVSISTLGDLIDQGYTLTASCEADPHNCRHSQEIDLVALAKRLGRDHSYLRQNLSHKLRCSRCGARGPGFVIGSPNGYNGRDRPHAGTSH